MPALVDAAVGRGAQVAARIELLLTLPITTGQAVLGKFLAAWVFTGIALALTFPIWITVNYLGSPTTASSSRATSASLLMAGGFLAIGSCISGTTRNQVIAFILTVVICFLLLLAGFPLVLDFFRAGRAAGAVDAIAGLSFLTHFTDHQQGRDRPARPGLLRAADRRLPVRQYVVLHLKKAD